MTAHVEVLNFDPFFTLAGTFGVTLLVVTLALITIVLANTTIGNDLGTLSVRVREALKLSVSSEKMNDEIRSALDILFGQYRATWFTVEVLPIPVYFQIAMLLSLGTMIPRFPLTLLAIVPISHVMVWTGLITMLKRNQHRVNDAIKAAALPTNVEEKAPDAHLLGRRVLLWELPLIAVGVMIYCLPWTIWVILGSVLVSLAIGMAQTIRVTANIIIAPVYNVADYERLKTKHGSTRGKRNLASRAVSDFP